MKLFVPDIGEELKLVDLWPFNTICESRNESLFDAFEVPPEYRWQKTDPNRGRDYWKDGFDHWRPMQGGFNFSLPMDTVLKVDRVYIRKGQEDFSSMTFIVISSPDLRVVAKKKGGFAPKAVRFWVKLNETRNIEIEG